jgi:hypothetical protein
MNYVRVFYYHSLDFTPVPWLSVYRGVSNALLMSSSVNPSRFTFDNRCVCTHGKLQSPSVYIKNAFHETKQLSMQHIQQYTTPPLIKEKGNLYLNLSLKVRFS